MKDLTDWVRVDNDGFEVDGTIVDSGERFVFWYDGKKFCGTAGWGELMEVGVLDVFEMDPMGWGSEW
jgi:hypothetical protein